MHEMMSRCMELCQAMSESIGQLRRTVAQAHESNDPAKMRAALGQVEAHFSAMDKNMAGCMNMMSQGQRGMMDQGKMDHGEMRKGTEQDR